MAAAVRKRGFAPEFLTRGKILLNMSLSTKRTKRKLDLDDIKEVKNGK